MSTNSILSKIRQEIERRINILTNVYAEQMERNDEEMMNYYHGKVIALEELLTFLDTLSGQPDKSLEEEVKNYFQGYWPGMETEEQCNTDMHFTPPAIIRLARHFAEWQKQHDAELIEIAYNDGITIGMTKQKEQMLKDAVEGKVNQDGFLELSNGEVIDICPTLKRCALGLHIGDKVHIVVLKEEEE